MCFFLLNESLVTHVQVIYEQHNRCNNNGDNDLVLKIRELQLEFSAYRKRSIETERVLQDRLNKMEHDFPTYRNASMESEDRLQDQITELKGKLEITTEARKSRNDHHIYLRKMFFLKTEHMHTQKGLGQMFGRT